MAVIKRIASKATPKKIVSYLTQEEKTEEKKSFFGKLFKK